MGWLKCQPALVEKVTTCYLIDFMAYEGVPLPFLAEPDPLSPLFDEGPASLPQPQATPAELKILGQLQEKINHAGGQKKPRERGWEYNRLLLRGEQNIVQDYSTGDVIKMAFEGEADELLSTDNQLLPIARAYVGKLIRTIPTCVVLPRTEDRSDLRGAEVVDSFLDFQWRNLSMKLKYKRSMEYLSWAGTSIFEMCWNQELGRKLSYCAACSFSTDIDKPGEPCPVCMVSSMDPMTGHGDAPPLLAIRDGDLDLTLHDPRDFFPEPGVPEIELMQYCYTRTAQPINTLRRRYPDKAGLIHAQDGIYTDRTLVYSVGTSLSTRYDTQQLKGHAYHYCIHLAPSGKNPKGLIVYMACDRIMEVHESPYWDLFEQLPFVAMRADREARVFWGIPPIDNAGPLQKERNTLATQTRENRELTGNPKLMVGDNSGIDVDRVNTIPGEVLKIKPTPFGRPAFLIPPALPQYVYGEFQRLAQAMRDKFGVTENELGMAPPDESGRHSAFLEAQSNEAVGPIVIENMEAWAKIHYWAALLGLTCYSPERKWAVRGNEMPRSYSFGMAKDVRLSSANFMLADEDSLSRNPALRLQQSVMLLEKGVYTNPATGMPDMKKFMRHAGLRMPGMANDPEANLRAQAAQVPERIRRGEMIIPKPWHDARIYAEELLEWLIAEGETAPEPVVREVYNLWTIYAQALAASGMLTPADARLMPNAGLAPPPQAQGTVGAPSALPNGPGTGAPPGAPEEVGQLIQQADASAESMARPGEDREGSTV